MQPFDRRHTPATSTPALRRTLLLHEAATAPERRDPVRWYSRRADTLPSGRRQCGRPARGALPQDALDRTKATRPLVEAGCACLLAVASAPMANPIVLRQRRVYRPDLEAPQPFHRELPRGPSEDDASRPDDCRMRSVSRDVAHGSFGSGYPLTHCTWAGPVVALNDDTPPSLHANLRSCYRSLARAQAHGTGCALPLQTLERYRIPGERVQCR